MYSNRGLIGPEVRRIKDTMVHSRYDALDEGTGNLKELKNDIDETFSRLDGLAEAMAKRAGSKNDVTDSRLTVSTLRGFASYLQRKIDGFWVVINELEQRTRPAWTAEWNIDMQDARHFMAWEGSMALTENTRGEVLGVLTYECVRDAEGNPIVTPTFTDWISATTDEGLLEGIFRESCSCGFDDYWEEPEACDHGRLPGTTRFEMSSDGTTFTGQLVWGGRVIFIDGIRLP